MTIIKFHTKLIQSILDPVAQQVSNLVILHEEAEKGGIIPDITTPVVAVKSAVDNLINVAKTILKSTKDEELLRDMPPALKVAEGACDTLLEAAKGLSQEVQTPHAKSLLLDGTRSIIHGMSQVLFVYDQAEVRKIVKSCEGVIEYLKVAEVVQSMDELVMFTQNLEPGMTSMIAKVDARREDLTNPSHANMLAEESDQLKRALPLLLSAMKVFVTLKKGAEGSMDIQENRNYIVASMTDSLKEVIRVLWLTTPTEEAGQLGEGASGRSTGGAPPGSIAAKVFQAKELLQETGKSRETDEAGIAAVHSVTADARRIAQSFSPQRRTEVEKLCNEIDSLVRELAELQARGEGASERAQAIALAISQKLDELEESLKTGVTKQVVTDFKDPTGPLAQLTEAATAKIGTPGREETFAERVTAFNAHANKMSTTAADLARSGGVMDKQVADDLISTAGKVKALAPQVVHAANILFHNPDNQDAAKHYHELKQDYQKQVQKMTKMVDGAVDPTEFLAASEDEIKNEIELAKAAIKAGNQAEAFAHVAGAARMANRVITVTQGEIENSEDPEFKASLQQGVDGIKQSIAPMIAAAKTAISQPGSEAAQAMFTQKSDQLVSKVHDVYAVIDNHYHPPPPPTPPPPPPEEVPDVPPLPSEESAPSRPPLPQEEVAEIEEITLDESSNPIGFAAQQLHQDAKQWDEKDNNMVAAAKKMAKLMLQMSKFAKGEEGEVHSKKEFINTARLIAKESEEVVKMARMVAEACTDKRMKRTLLQVVDKIPTIATQLKIIAAVKATRQGGDDAAADREATEMLTNNAQNLMKAVSEVLYSTEAASIRVNPESEAAKLGLRWVKRSVPKARSL